MVQIAEGRPPPRPGRVRDESRSSDDGVNTVTWQATDDSSNTATCIQRVTVTTFGFDGFYVGAAYVGDNFLGAYSGSNLTASFRVTDASGQSVTNTSVVTDKVWDAPLCHTCTTTFAFNATTQRFDLSYQISNYWSGQTRTLTITLSDGTTHQLNVSFDMPSAAFTSSCPQFTCTFDGSGSAAPGGAITAYDWTFGDGGTGTGATPSHSYAAAGSYTVTLTVTSSLGGTTSVSHVAQLVVVPISFVGATHVAGNAPTMTVTGRPGCRPVTACCCSPRWPTSRRSRRRPGGRWSVRRRRR